MRTEDNKYKLTFLIRYTADAFFYPFFSLYLYSIGKTAKDIGLILMILPLISVFVNPIWSYFARTVKHNKIFAIVFSLVEALFILILLNFNQLFVIVLVTIALGAVNQPFFILLDSQATIYTIDTKKNYSAIRLFGSLGYAIGVVISGYIIKNFGVYSISFAVTITLYLIATILIITLKPLKAETKTEPLEKSDFKLLSKNKNYLLFLGFYVISIATLFGGEAFWGPYFKLRGISEENFGWISFVAYIVEVGFLFLLAKYGEKIKLKLIMILIPLINGIRYLIYAFNLSIGFLVFSSILRAFVMASILHVLVRYLSRHVTQKNLTLAMIIYGSIKNIFQALITVGGGFIIEFYNYTYFFIIISIIAFCALFFIKYREAQS
ncbi:MAG: MFS transporter [Acholeplasmataceae bacterium]|jgi:PPP family 3-phenylpropionic acid transporter|nr:MFS transporter [Acholeplasmataceae bacterium]